jgi:hypothetical protein
MLENCKICEHESFPLNWKVVLPVGKNPIVHRLSLNWVGEQALWWCWQKKIRILYNISFRYFVCFPKRKISTSWEIFRFSCIHFLSTHISIMKTNFSHCYFGRISSFINVTITFLFAWTQKNHILNLNINYWNEHEYWNHVNLLIIQCTM